MSTGFGDIFLGVVDKTRDYIVDTTEGTLSYAVRGVVGGGENMCWYIDSRFCSSFHQLKKYFDSPARARFVVYLVAFLSSAIAGKPTGGLGRPLMLLTHMTILSAF